MMKLLYSFMCFCLLVSASSCSKCKSANADAIGQYVYRDDNYVIHSDSECKNLLRGKDEHGHDIYSKEYIDTLSFVTPDCFRVCSECVSEKEYEHLMNISKRNNVNKIMPGVITNEYPNEVSAEDVVPDEVIQDEVIPIEE